MLEPTCVQGGSTSCSLQVIKHSVGFGPVKLDLPHIAANSPKRSWEAMMLTRRSAPWLQARRADHSSSTGVHTRPFAGTRLAVDRTWGGALRRSARPCLRLGAARSCARAPGLAAPQPRCALACAARRRLATARVFALNSWALLELPRVWNMAGANCLSFLLQAVPRKEKHTHSALSRHAIGTDVCGANS